MSIVPAKLAFNIIEPINGTNESLSPFIFLHAFGESKEFWCDIPQRLSNETGRRSYLIDTRDHGDSEWTSLLSMSAIIQDYIHFIDSQNISKAIIIGHSMGGWTASRVALRMPEKVELLFIEDMIVHNFSDRLIEKSVEDLGVLEEAARSIPKDLNEDEVTRFVVDFKYSKIPPEIQKTCTKKECFYKLKYPLKRTSDGSYVVKHNMALFKSCVQKAEYDHYDPEGIFKGPTYIFYGNLSPIKVKQHEGKIREHFPFVRLILFDGATHNIHIEFPEKFINKILSILQKHT